MKYICKFILRVLGWNIYVDGELSDKNVLAMLPHTSYWDGVIGFIVLKSLGIKYKTLSAEWLFRIPGLRFVMKHIMNASPVKKGSLSSIRASIDIFEKNDKVSLVICPEGQLKATDKWGMGFHYIAKKAGVGIVFAIVDYKTKNISLVEVTNVDRLSENDMIVIIRRLCNAFPCGAKHPNKFLLPKQN